MAGDLAMLYPRGENQYMPGRRLDAFSRRGLLGAAALPLLAQERTTAAAGWPRLGRQLRVGMVGLEGHPSVVYDVVAQHPDLALTAIARDQVPVEGITRREPFRNTRVYPDFGSMFKAESFDVMAVCNTNGHRAEVIVEAARRGWHVVAEKPVALNAAELRDVQNAVAKAGIGFTSLLPMRYDPPLFTMASLVRDGAVGEVQLMNGQKSYKLGSRAAWFQDAALYGSTMQWIGVHMLDLMHWVSGQRFRSVYSYEQNVGQPALGDMQNVSGAVLQLANGGVATLNMDYLRPDAASTHGDDRLRVAGTKGILEYRVHDGLLSLRSEERESARPALLHPEFPLLLEFLLNVYQKRPMLIQKEEIFHVVMALNAARQSSRDGCAASLPQ
ncbi:MAG: Gfo/Idh/MocA family oxidoreductase [Bryobacterales bacterium]|nr:Gfo/Idh/MocA family oxidoreductase [Bryobacterales bacterium]